MNTSDSITFSSESCINNDTQATGQNQSMCVEEYFDSDSTNSGSLSSGKRVVDHLSLPLSTQSEQQSSISFQDNELSNFADIQISNPNITKNIIKSYFKFLTNKTNSEIIQHFIPNKMYKDSIREIKKYIKRYKFNNKFLARLLQSKGYNKIFEYYLTFDISEWLLNSKINNMEKHKETIEFLKECCVNTESIKTLNNKNKNQ